MITATSKTLSDTDTLTGQAETRLMEFTRSELFSHTFKEGMAMVEEAASYLDGAGREDSKQLSRADALVYASTSMRLTTRLMQIASWLLVQRALKEGEITTNEARDDKYRLSAETGKAGEAQFSDSARSEGRLPETLETLMDRTDQLFERISRLDRSLYGTIAAQSGKTVADQINLLQAAFQSRL